MPNPAENPLGEPPETPAAGQRLWPYVALVLALLAVATLIPRLFGPGRQQANQPYARELLIFNSYARLTFWAPEAQAAAAADEMVAELERLHALLNVYAADSEISRLNASAHLQPFACSPQLWAAIDAARAAHRLTGGVFDVSVGPLMKLWGFHERRQALPSDDELAAARALVGLDKMLFDDSRRTVSFPQPGMRLDFGGLAKGYALDICRAIADQHGLNRGMIDLGGNVACLAEPPPGKQAYTVGIRHPGQPDKLLETVQMLDQCIATSGNYERWHLLDGQVVHHIVDPTTGRPVPARASVTVIVPRGLATDVFSTAIFVAGEELAKALRAREPSARVMIVSTTPETPDQLTIQRFNWPAPDATGRRL